MNIWKSTITADPNISPKLGNAHGCGSALVSSYRVSWINHRVLRCFFYQAPNGITSLSRLPRSSSSGAFITRNSTWIHHAIGRKPIARNPYESTMVLEGNQLVCPYWPFFLLCSDPFLNVYNCDRLISAGPTAYIVVTYYPHGKLNHSSQNVFFCCSMFDQKHATHFALCTNHTKYFKIYKHTQT